MFSALFVYYGYMHSYKVITDVSDLTVYVSLKHAIGIVGYDTEIYLPIETVAQNVEPREERIPIDHGDRPSIYDNHIGDESDYERVLASGEYDQENRTGSLYNPKDHEYRYNDTPDFIARLAFLDPQDTLRPRGDTMFISEENTVYTLKRTRPGKKDYCPGDIQLYSKILVHYGKEDLSYFVNGVSVLRNPNAKDEKEEALIRLDLVQHI